MPSKKWGDWKMKIPRVAYASEEKLTGDDVGSLDISEVSIQFTGKKYNFQINKSNIQNISIQKIRFSWINYLVYSILSIFFVSLTSWPVIPVIVLLLFLGLGNLIGAKWVLVEYLDQNKNPEKAYFVDPSGPFGDAQKIYDSIESFRILESGYSIEGETAEKTQTSAPSRCPHCDTIVGPENEFCSECGKPIQTQTASLPAASECPSCGFEVQPDDTFCSSCGKETKEGD